MATTRGELRRMIGNRLGDVTVLTATANGSTTRLTDTIRLSGSIEDPRNRDIIFTSGTNLGVERRVTGSDMTTGYVDFAAVTSTVAGDTAEMYNFRGRGWRLPEYHDAINQAIAMSWPLYREKAVADLDPDAWDSSAGTILLSDLTSSGGTHVYAVYWVDSTGALWDVPRSLSAGASGWTYLNNDVLTVRGSLIPPDSAISLGVMTKPAPLLAEDDETGINAEWLVHQAAAILAQNVERNPNYNYTSWQSEQMQADRLRSAIRTRIPSGTVAVG